MNEPVSSRSLQVDSMATLALLDEILAKSRVRNDRRSRSRLIGGLAVDAILVAIILTAWLAFESVVPLPSTLVSGSVENLLPIVPLAIAGWLFWTANRRSREVDEIEDDLVLREIDSLKRMVADSR